MSSIQFKGTASTVLTSTNNKITLPAGYYDNITVSTDVTSLAGTITYTHHQCSNTENNVTYTDDIIGTSNAASVNEITVNGKTVSTIQGGCYTTPYYYVSRSITKTGTCTATVHVDGPYGANNELTYRYWFTHSSCGEKYTGGHKDWHQANEGRYTGPTTYSHTYSYTENAKIYTSEPLDTDTVLATYYLKSCGYYNGEVLSVTLTY